MKVEGLGEKGQEESPNVSSIPEERRTELQATHAGVQHLPHLPTLPRAGHHSCARPTVAEAAVSSPTWCTLSPHSFPLPLSASHNLTFQLLLSFQVTLSPTGPCVLQNVLQVLSERVPQRDQTAINPG